MRARSRFAALLTASLVATGGIVLTAGPAYAAAVTVSNYSELTTAISNADDGDVIIFDADIVADSITPWISKAITIDGDGHTYDGNSLGNTFFTISGASSASFIDLNITNTGGTAILNAAGGPLTLSGVQASGSVYSNFDLSIADSSFTAGWVTAVGTGLSVNIENTSFSNIPGSAVDLDLTNSNAVLTDVTVAVASVNGIDAELSGGTLTATGLDIDGAEWDGVSVFADNGANVTITGSSSDNNENNGYSLFAWGATTSISVADSSADSNGDGFSVAVGDSGTVSLQRVLATGNEDDGIQVSSGHPDDEQVSGLGGTVVISDSTSDGNDYGLYVTAYQEDVLDLDLTVTGSTFSNNEGDGILGGADDDTVVRVTNSTMSGNGGWGIDFSGTGTLLVEHTTITDNTDDADPSAPTLGLSGALVATLDHVIVAGNWAVLDVEADQDVDLTVRNSLIGTANADATSAITADSSNLFGVTDPQLGPLAANGGPTLTHLPDETSPAVNAGDSAIAGAPSFDQRGSGHPRIVGTIDIGSVERPAGLAATGTEPAPLALTAIALLLAGSAFALRRKSPASA